MLHQNKKKKIGVFFWLIELLFSFRMELPKKCTRKASKAKAMITIEEQAIVLYTTLPFQGMSSIF